MSLQEMPITNEQTDYRFSIVLDGTRYFLHFYYNARIDTWFTDLEDASQAAILIGIPCLTNVIAMFTRYAIDGVLPWGDMLILDSAGEGRNPTLENFSLAVSAFYLSILT